MAGRRRALLLANAAYAETSGYRPLNAPPNDARRLEAILKAPDRGAFDDVARLDEPTRGQMLRAAKELLIEAGPDDVVLIYYSGHGDVDLDGALFLVASDTEKGHLESTGVETETLSRMIQRAAVGRTVLILDCCHAGAFVIPGSKSGEDVLQTRLDDYARGSGTYMLMATSARDVASDGPPGGLSVLTRHVVDGLAGAADEDRDGTISVRELSRYLDRQMARHETQRFLESGLNRQGDVLLAYSGIDREAELIRQVRTRLLEWRQKDLIASDVLAKALTTLEARPEDLDPRYAQRRSLLLGIDDATPVGGFLHEWYGAGRVSAERPPWERGQAAEVAPGSREADLLEAGDGPGPQRAGGGRTTTADPAAVPERQPPDGSWRAGGVAADVATGVGLSAVAVTLSRVWQIASDNRVSTNESAVPLLVAGLAAVGAARTWRDRQPSRRGLPSLNDSARVVTVVLAAFVTFVLAVVAGIVAV